MDDTKRGSRSETILCSAASFTFLADEVQTQDKSFSKDSNKKYIGQ